MQNVPMKKSPPRSMDSIGIGLSDSPRMNMIEPKLPTMQRPTATTRNLLEVPQEIQDIIFDLAYPDEPTVTIQSLHDWERREQLRQVQDPHNAYRPKPFPAVKVDEFMVSKAYFRNAARAYIGSMSGANSVRFGKRGIGRAYLKSVDLVSLATVTSIYSLMPCVQSVTVQLVPSDVPTESHKSIFRDEFDDADFAESKLVKSWNIADCRGLRNISLSYNHCISRLFQYETVKIPARKEMCKRNLQTLERFLQSQVTGSSTESGREDYDCTDGGALYFGSDVRLHESKLRKASDICKAILRNRRTANGKRGLSELSGDSDHDSDCEEIGDPPQNKRLRSSHDSSLVGRKRDRSELASSDTDEHASTCNEAYGSRSSSHKRPNYGHRSPSSESAASTNDAYHLGGQSRETEGPTGSPLNHKKRKFSSSGTGLDEAPTWRKRELEDEDVPTNAVSLRQLASTQSPAFASWARSAKARLAWLSTLQARIMDLIDEDKLSIDDGIELLGDAPDGPNPLSDSELLDCAQADAEDQDDTEVRGAIAERRGHATAHEGTIAIEQKGTDGAELPGAGDGGSQLETTEPADTTQGVAEQVVGSETRPILIE